MIQLINYSGKNENIDSSMIIASKIASPKSLDEYSINIIDLSDQVIWLYKGQEKYTIDCIDDLKNLGIMVERSINSKTVIILPQEIEYIINCTSRDYRKNMELKNVIDIIRTNILNKFLNVFNGEIIFENTRTKINGIEVGASFYFDFGDQVLTKSISSNKDTTVVAKDIILTTLNLISEDEILSFLAEIELINNRIEVPIWINNLKMFNDEQQLNTICEHEEIIKSSENIIYQAKEVLDSNNEYKSILYTNGNDLLKVVFKLLEQLLNYNLSTFVDEKKEDFLMRFEDVTIIGEVKGVTSNVRSEHVSQLELHTQKYKDKLSDDGKEEVVKSVLIINHQRSNELEKRQPIHEEQIKLAERNESLIIDTFTLLRYFEQFRNNNLTSDEFKILLKEEKGLLNYSDVEVILS